MYVFTDAIEDAHKGDYTIFKQWNSDWYHIAPISFQYERNTSRTNYITQELKKFYFNGPITLENINGMAHVSFIV